MAESLELADESLGFAGRVDQALVVVGPEVFDAGDGVVGDAPDDRQHRPGHRDDGFLVAPMFDESAVVGSEEGIWPGRGCFTDSPA
ncbi:hypothetical protein [Streptomyces smaragdinus]|uniref:hypothetical protein n=1 Tax=Streptomyces smaragdinus TaxID=2585196 RepID=UPI0012965A8F|nr:hypothetical protein [Streptomyces smaragdinus]